MWIYSCFPSADKSDVKEQAKVMPSNSFIYLQILSKMLQKGGQPEQANYTHFAETLRKFFTQSQGTFIPGQHVFRDSLINSAEKRNNRVLFNH